MKTFRLPQTDLDVSSVILGLMRIKEMSDSEIRELVETAQEVGITMFDHADIYGGERHLCEKRFGEAMQLTPAQREGMIIQSKTGIRKGWFDFSKEHILQSVDESLAALQTDYIDVLLLHRPDTLVEPEEVAEAFETLVAAGKVRHFGVSNHKPGQIELLKSAVKQPLLFDQMQLSIAHANLFAQGIAANMGAEPQSADRDNGLLDYARLKGITLQAWSPFMDTKRNVYIGDRQNHAELNDLMNALAEKYGVTANGINVAWIARHPANIQTVLGTTKPQRVRECAAGSDIKLEREEWYQLFRAGGNIVP